MNWNVEAKAKFDRMISMIPFFQRKMAERLAGKKAEENAAARGASEVSEDDIVSAFLSETPAPFRKGMRETAVKAGFKLPDEQ
ncbi:MAG: PCP reductase family protein [Nitrospirota bacterium]